MSYSIEVEATAKSADGNPVRITTTSLAEAVTDTTGENLQKQVLLCAEHVIQQVLFTNKLEALELSVRLKRPLDETRLPDDGQD